jgi:hypothetical protein
MNLFLSREILFFDFNGFSKHYYLNYNQSHHYWFISGCFENLKNMRFMILPSKVYDISIPMRIPERVPHIKAYF